MKRCLTLFLFAGVLAQGLGAVTPSDGKVYDFPIYTNQPPGRQLEGGHAPATTAPLPPEETRRRLSVPPGFEVRLFASEPAVANPVAMTWDERGRLWVLELYEYPKGAPPTRAGRDRIKILEDTDADGVADKAHVWADGLSLAMGLALGRGGAYVGQAPHLLFLKDTDGDDRADTREEVLTGFGLEDRHELLNGFAWGPDGWLYMTHGVFTHSNVRQPGEPAERAVQMDAAVARFHPITKRFEVFADGTSNPWGVDWNERGDAFVEACVIHHLFHMAPGGQYNRQGGTWPNPYGYVRDLPSRGLPALVDWRHYRAAHSGINVYLGDQYPEAWKGLVLLGNIHQNAVNCDRLQTLGATFRAVEETELLGPEKGEHQAGAGNFFASEDPWVRPVAIHTGPDGVVWVMDWHDRYPCYQNAQADPEGVDREYGRIWRVVWVGDRPGRAVPSRPDPKMDLTRLGTADLVRLLDHPNVWQRRQAQRLLVERGDPETGRRLRRLLEPVRAGAPGQPSVMGRRSAFWTMTSAGLLTDPELLGACVGDADPVIRAWTARHLADHGDGSVAQRRVLERLAGDEEAIVRAAVAAALRRWTGGSYTVNSTRFVTVRAEELQPIFEALLRRPTVPEDSYYPHILWMAMEPLVAEDPRPFLEMFGRHDGSLSAYALYRTMRRINDLRDQAERAKHLNDAMVFLGGLADRPNLAKACLEGLITAQESKGAPPTVDMEPIFARLLRREELNEPARRLATLYGDTSASRVLLARINDPSASLEARLEGVQAAREAKSDSARAMLLELIGKEQSNQRLLVEGLRALGTFGGDDLAYAVVEAWKHFEPATRRTAAEVLVTRSKWSRALMAGVDRKIVLPADISAVARRALAQSADATVRDHADRVLGRYRATGEDKIQLIATKRQAVFSGEPEIEKGRAVARQACFVCHKLHGEGADVGPDLTGVGRSSLDALLHNIIDPNEVVGHGYESTEVELKDGSILTGRRVEETDTLLRLISSGPIEHAIAKSDIALIDGKPAVRVLEMSLMPEGLEQMPDNDFRDMIWFLLNPPEDQRPWTPELRRELLGIEEPVRSAAGEPGVDWESVSHWDPDWRVVCPPFEGAPAKLSDYHERRNVLMTHPIDRETPCGLERSVALPAGRSAILALEVAAHDRGDWVLRVRVNGKPVLQQRVDHQAPRWKPVRVDLSQFAGQSIHLRLENAANDWAWEFGYWAGPRLELEGLDTARAPIDGR